jgi:ribose 5-phosphate isomerase A
VAEAGNQADELKRAAAVRAADWVESGMTVGLGTGSTIRFLLDELALRMQQGKLKGIRGVPTSEDTARRSVDLGIPLITLEQAGELDVTIDGADEVDPELRLIKGLGGALLREKIVAAASGRLVIVVDASKMVQILGTRAPLPVEVEPFGRRVHEAFFRELGANPTPRRGWREPIPHGWWTSHLRLQVRERDRGSGSARAAPQRPPRNHRERSLPGDGDHIVVARPEGLEVMNRADGGAR